MAAVAMVVTQPVDMAQSSMLFLAAPVPVAGKAGALNAESLAAESKRWKAKNIEGNTHTDVFKKKYKKPLQSWTKQAKCTLEDDEAIAGQPTGSFVASPELLVSQPQDTRRRSNEIWTRPTPHHMQDEIIADRFPGGVVAFHCIWTVTKKAYSWESCLEHGSPIPSWYYWKIGASVWQEALFGPQDFTSVPTGIELIFVNSHKIPVMAGVLSLVEEGLITSLMLSKGRWLLDMRLSMVLRDRLGQCLVGLKRE
jgi:hypothetical protein